MKNAGECRECTQRKEGSTRLFGEIVLQVDSHLPLIGVGIGLSAQEFDAFAVQTGPIVFQSGKKLGKWHYSYVIEDDLTGLSLLLAGFDRYARAAGDPALLRDQALPDGASFAPLR